MAEARESEKRAFKGIPIEELPVVYLDLGGDEYVPTFFRPGGSVEYRWRHVRVHRAQLPGLDSSGSFTTSIFRPSGHPVQEVDPPKRYFALGGDDFVVGYYDHTNAIFYPWKGVVVSRAHIRDESEILARDEDSPFASIPIDAPSASTPPSHLYTPFPRRKLAPGLSLPENGESTNRHPSSQRREALALAGFAVLILVTMWRISRHKRKGI